jgi:hypothetical protein
MQPKSNIIIIIIIIIIIALQTYTKIKWTTP